MNQDDCVEKKVVELLDQSLKGINKRTAARLQYIRNNALEHFESGNRMIPDGKAAHTFAAIAWHKNTAKLLFLVFFLLLLTWAGSMWHIRHHGDDTGTADANFLADDQDGDAHPDDPLELWHHPARSR
jgi:zona occludens toxin (predicted ATPase)